MNRKMLILLFLSFFIFRPSKSMELFDDKTTTALSIIGTGAALGAGFSYATAKYTKSYSLKNDVKTNIYWGVGAAIPVVCAALMGSEESCLKFSTLNCALLGSILCAICYRFGTFVVQANSYNPNNYTREEITGGYATLDARLAKQIPNFACIFSSVFLTSAIIVLRVLQNM